MPRLEKEDPKGDSWIHEIKYDGYRTLCFLQNGKARLVSRNGLDWTASFGRVAEAAEGLRAKTAILDRRDRGLSGGLNKRFQRPSELRRGKAGADLHVVYDIPHFGGYDVDTPLIERKRFLEKLVKDRKGKRKSSPIPSTSRCRVRAFLRQRRNTISKGSSPKG